MKWITREKPKIDRIACPWLIKRFIDINAEIIFVKADDVLSSAERLNAIPFDVSGVEYSHYNDQCTFDYFLKKHKLTDPALKRMAAIVRGADTDQHEIALQSSGLEAIFSGLSFNSTNDHELLNLGMVIYDGLYSWAKHLYKQKHAQNDAEQLLIRALNNYTTQNKKVPQWAKELRGMIQDQVDTNMALTLQKASEELEINPAYLSREFSKYFDDLSFGEYIRKLRIEKAINYMATTDYSLTEIAYLTGFSDQSHFNRIFKKQTGKTPSGYKKELLKGKTDTNG